MSVLGHNDGTEQAHPSRESSSANNVSFILFASASVRTALCASLGLFSSRGRGGNGGSLSPPGSNVLGGVNNGGAGGASLDCERNKEMFCKVFQRETFNRARSLARTLSSLYLITSFRRVHSVLQDLFSSCYPS